MNNSLKAVTNLPASASPLENKQRRLQRERLASQFTDVLQQFQSLQKSSAQKEKESAFRVRASFISSHESEAGSIGSGGEKKQVQLDLDELQELREREEAVRRIESDIVDVNQIFNELALLVQDQGETIDTIDANIGTALNQVEEGTNQLEKAVVYQQKARKKMIILIAILLILATIVGLIIYFTTKK